MNRPRGGERGASDMSRARCTRSLAEICGTCRRVSGLCPAGVPVGVSRCRSLESQRVPFGPNRRTGGISFRSPRRRSGLTGPTASPPSTLFSRRPGLIGNSSWNAATARDSGRGRWCSVGVDGPRIPLARQLTEPRPRSRVLGLVVAVSRFARLPQRRSPRIGIGFHANICTNSIRNADDSCQYSASGRSSCGSASMRATDCSPNWSGTCGTDLSAQASACSSPSGATWTAPSACRGRDQESRGAGDQGIRRSGACSLPLISCSSLISNFESRIRPTPVRLPPPRPRVPGPGVGRRGTARRRWSPR
jgi:hypothetical protein